MRRSGMKKIKNYLQSKVGLLLLFMSIAAVQAVQAVTVDLINQALQQATYSQQVNALANLIPAAQGKAINTDIQNTFGTALVHVFNQRASATPQDMQALKGLLGSASISGLLNPAQQNYVKTSMLPELLTAPTQAAPAQQATATTSTGTIDQIRKEQDIITKIQNLYTMMQQNAGKQMDQNTQSAFATALVEAFNEARTTQSFILQVLNAATQTPLLNADQQKYVRETMIPELTVEVPNVPATIAAAPTQTATAVTTVAPTVVQATQVIPTAPVANNTAATQTGVIPTATPDIANVATATTTPAEVGAIPLETTKKKKKKKRKKRKKGKKRKKTKKKKKKKGTKKKKRKKKKRKKKKAATAAQPAVTQPAEQLTIPLA